MYIRYLDFVERENLSVLVWERESVCVYVCQMSLLFTKYYEYQKFKKPKKSQKKKRSQTNIAYHTRTFANVRVRPVNWTYANIRNYDCIYNHEMHAILCTKNNVIAYIDLLHWKVKRPSMSICIRYLTI